MNLQPWFQFCKGLFFILFIHEFSNYCTLITTKLKYQPGFSGWKMFTAREPQDYRVRLFVSSSWEMGSVQTQSGLLIVFYSSHWWTSNLDYIIQGGLTNATCQGRDDWQQQFTGHLHLKHRTQTHACHARHTGIVPRTHRNQKRLWQGKLCGPRGWSVPWFPRERVIHSAEECHGLKSIR